MMRQVIAYRYLPSRPPFSFTAVAWLLLDRFNAGELAWGIAGVTLGCIWMISLALMLSEDGVHPDEVRRF